MGKRPPMSDWPKLFETNVGEIALWERVWHIAENTGVFCRNTPTLDIDIDAAEASEAVEMLVRERHEEHGNILVRFGKAPRRAIPFQTNEPFKKITGNVIAPDGSEQKIEFLCDGQQVIVAGIHPDTHKPYSWHGGTPETTPRESLPYVRAGDAQALVEAAVDLLCSEHGYRRKADRPKVSKDKNGAGPDEHAADWAYLTENILAGSALHDSLRDLAGKLVASGMGGRAAGNYLRGLMSKSQALRDDRWRARYNDIERLVESARASPSPDDAPDIRSELPPPVNDFVIVPYGWPDPTSIPRRRFLYGAHYMRGTVSATIGAGGRLKTTNELIEMIGMACGKNLLTGEPLPEGAMRVLHLNGEEDQPELDRRVAAICQLFGVSKADCGDRLHIMSVRDTPMCLGITKGNSTELNLAILGKLEAQIRAWKIDVLTIDPLISFHRVREHDNGDMDLLIKRGLGDIARRAGAAIDICHHPGKARPGQPDVTVEDARGASALLWAVRSARVFNFMMTDEAKKLGVGESERRLHVRITNGKANNGPLGAADWIKIIPIMIANGEEIAALQSWKPANPFEGMSTDDIVWVRDLTKTGGYRRDSRSPKWLGFAIALHLKMPLARDGDKLPKIEDRKDAARVRSIIEKWLKNKIIVVEERKDEQGKDREYILPGPNEPETTTSTLGDEEF
jgi:hypothetical protein